MFIGEGVLEELMWLLLLEFFMLIGWGGKWWGGEFVVFGFDIRK